jgi:hypothetical protein
MAWTCPNCGTKNEAGLFNFYKEPTRLRAVSPGLANRMVMRSILEIKHLV